MRTYTSQDTYISKLKAHYKPPCECEDFICPWCDTIHNMAHELEKDSKAQPLTSGISWEDQKASLPDVLPIDLEYHADYFAGRCCIQLREGDHDV